MAGTTKLDFFVNAAAGTSTDFAWQGGQLAFVAEATWGGGNIKLQYQSMSNAWVDVASSTLSANGMLLFTLPPTRLRAVAATATAIYASAVTVPTLTTR